MTINSENKSPKIRVAAAVVTYNKKNQLLVLLERLRTLSIPVFVTANACSDGTTDAVNKDFPEVGLIESPVNLGGTGGFNCSILAALETGSEYVLLLDDDALPEPDCIEKLVDFLDKNAGYSFAAPSILISSKPDILQETGGAVNFLRSLPIEAFNRFIKKQDFPEIPEIIDIDYASACCLLVRASAIKQVGILDWNYFIFSDDVDFCLRLGRQVGKGACVTNAVAFHDFPWAKPFSTMRLYYYHRNNLYFLSKMATGAGKFFSIYISLVRLFRDILTSWLQGDKEHCSIIFSALKDALTGRYGAWTAPAFFPEKRKRIDSKWFKKNKIRRILVDLSVDEFAPEIINCIRSLSDKKNRTDLLCETLVNHKQMGFCHVYERGSDRISFLKSFFNMNACNYDLVITDAAMSVRRITSMPGRLSAFYHNGELFEAETRPFLSLAAFFTAPFIGLAGASAVLWRFMKRPEPDKAPKEAVELLAKHGIMALNSGNGFNKKKNGSTSDKTSIQKILSSGNRFPLRLTPFFYDRVMGRLLPFFKVLYIKSSTFFGVMPHDWALKPGPGEAAAGYAEWCRLREKIAPVIYKTEHNGSSPLFSILVPVCDPEPVWLHSCVESVKKQTYKGWELILVDDASKNARIHRMLEGYQQDSRIKVLFNEKRSGISAATNRAAENAESQYIFFLDHDDILDRFCLSAFAEKIIDADESKPVSMIYADEDRFDKSMRRTQPGFKPSYSPELFLGTNYIHHPVAVRTELFKKIGGLKSEYDGSQDHDFLLRLLEVEDNVVHIPDILYHMRIHPRSLSSGPAAKPKAHRLDKQIIEEALERRNIKAEIRDTECGFPGYSRIIRKIDKMPRVSVILSSSFYASHDQKWIGATEVIKSEKNVSIAAAFNKSAEGASGEILIFADGSVSPSDEWLEIIVPHLLRDDVGVVTGKIVHADGTLFSCGLSLGINDDSGCLFGSWHQGLDASGPGYGGWMSLDHEVMAVSWKFMAVRKNLFFENGGFDAGFLASGFDIDLCLRLWKNRGLKNLALPGCVVTIEQNLNNHNDQWNNNDSERLIEKWGDVLSGVDPYLNPNYSRIGKGVRMAGFAEIADRKLF